MVPEYDVKDVASDENLEVIVKTKGGGTGISEAHLTVFGVIGDKIVQFGNFVIERISAFGEGEEAYRERLSGDVSFPEKNSLVYRYSQVVTEHDKTTVATEAIEKFAFDSKTMKYERIEEPQRVVPSDR
jgi:hypothetical protein